MVFKRGRPTILTEEIIEEIARHVEAGNYVEVALSLAGVNNPTFYQWMRKARQAEAEARDGGELTYSQKMYLKLRARMNEAEAIAENTRLADITAAADHDPKWAAWFLERRFPGRWGKSQRLEIDQVPDDGISPGAFDFSGFTDSELEEINKLIRKARSNAAQCVC